MPQRKTFKYKLYTAKRNKKLHHLIEIGGAIYNHLLALHKRYYRLYKLYPSIYQIRAHITKLKRIPKYSWWKLLGSQAIQQIAVRIDNVYQQFFRNLKARKAGKTTRNVDSPTFRKISKAKSFTLAQAGWKLLGDNKLRIGKTIYKFFKSREIEGVIKTVTIKRDALGDLYVYFSCIIESKPINRVMTGKSAGFDFGLVTYLTGSDGTTYQAPEPFKQYQRHIAQANRSLSHKAKGSHNRHKARQHLARTHRRVANIRQAFHWDLAYKLCNRYDAVYLETLNLQAMKVFWGRKVSDLGFGNFVSILHYVASTKGAVVYSIDRWFQSTKICSVCHQVNNHITLRDRVWTCVFCSVTHQRDQNAATNIYQEGTSSYGGDPVRLASASVDRRFQNF